MSGLPSSAPGCASRAARDAEIAALRVRLAELGERVARMERAASRNSGNSSMPPSSDDLPGRRPPRSQRRAAERADKRRRGKQPGAPGCPAGVPDAPVTIGPSLRALAVYLVVFQHVPVERCRGLIAEVTCSGTSKTPPRPTRTRSGQPRRSGHCAA